MIKTVLICLVLLFACAILSYAQYDSNYRDSGSQSISWELIKERIAEKPYILIIPLFLPTVAFIFGLGFGTFLMLSVIYFAYRIFFPDSSFVGEIILGAITLYLIINREMM